VTRAVVDTNILVRAVISPRGAVGRVLSGLRRGDYTLLYSQALLDELADVLNRPRIRQKYHVVDRDITTLIRLILLRGEAVTPALKIAVCRDPKDNKFLEVAVAGRADVIVSEDGDLLAMHPFEEIPILSSGAFLQMLRKSG
jgi:putative PIN family toxin of toxin-antitoxin system